METLITLASVALGLYIVVTIGALVVGAWIALSDDF